MEALDFLLLASGPRTADQGATNHGDWIDEDGAPGLGALAMGA
jgi:hypothetical protein